MFLNQRGHLVFPANALLSEMDNLFKEMSANSFHSQNKKINNFPPTDIYYDKTSQKFIIEIIVAKYNKEDIKIDILTDKNILKISYHKKEEEAFNNDINTENNVEISNLEEIVKGISVKNFIKEYYFALPIDNVIPKIENGLLTIEVFVKEPVSSIKSIEIK